MLALISADCKIYDPDSLFFFFCSFHYMCDVVYYVYISGDPAMDFFLFFLV